MASEQGSLQNERNFLHTLRVFRHWTHSDDTNRAIEAQIAATQGRIEMLKHPQPGNKRSLTNELAKLRDKQYAALQKAARLTRTPQEIVDYDACGLRIHELLKILDSKF